MTKKIAFASILAVLLVAPFFVHGAVFKTDKSYYLEPGASINDNLYAVGGNINIAGTVNGDLLATGGSITALGPVLGDVAAAGGTINMAGKVEGDARVAGGNIFISNSTGGDLLMAGGQISVMSGSTIGKDVAIAGKNVTFEGSAGRDVNIKGNTVYINSVINGNLSVAAREIKLGPNALVQGNFDYSAPQEAVMAQGAVVHGSTNFNKTNWQIKTPISRGFVFGLMGIVGLVKSIMLFFAALVLLYFFKAQSSLIVEKSVSNFWKEVLIGFVVLVVVPVAVILSFISVIGAFLGFIVLLFYFVFLMLSSVVSILLFAKMSLRYLFKKDGHKLNWWVVAIATLAFWIISMIPFVGWIFVFIIFMSALGSTSSFIYKKLII